ncbi:MAG: ABC transporter permease [Micrococcales bacterium]|nr:ABC transporter permease [Micrococcales bacterium]NBR54552.1 ABC transporter permease [Micrococcales bacterium]NBR61369.1 ABC transporter permease [Actinomycetota bacterium]NBT46574.1 ABC transporter permease [Actinomycetota bacterium]NBY43866.1 ABC transporter permease [Micrococcales bacterium]
MTKTVKTPDLTETKAQSVLREIMAGDPVRIALSILLGFIIGAVFMVVFNDQVVSAWSNFSADPAYAFSTIWWTIQDGYGALFSGSVFNTNADNFIDGIRPLTETLRFAAPLIMAGLGVALTFRVGLFNIGATGQIMMGLAGATFVSTRMQLPIVIHMLVAVLAAVVFASVWGIIVGILKARTGAHEVIVTIMLNYVATNLFTYFLREPNILLEANGGGTPKSDQPAETAKLGQLFGSEFAMHYGVIIAILSVIFYWWLMERSTFGFRFRMVGHNASAARAAGIKVENTFVWALAISAAFAGLAAANQGLSINGGLTTSIEAGIGFDAITVALLGGSRAGGIVMAGLLFGAFKAGSAAMQVSGVSPDVLGVVKALIVLFIAAPPIIRAIYRLPKPIPKLLIPVSKPSKVSK